MRRYLTLLALLVVVLLIGVAAQAGPGNTHQDDRLGYKVRWPAGWTMIPKKPNEEWIASKFLSEKKYRWNSPDGWTIEHQPTMKVIAFIATAVKDKKEEIEVDGVGTVVLGKNPYKDYEDYMDRTYAGGGWHISKQEDTEINGIPTTCMEIKVTKLTRSGPKRIVTWIFRTPEVDFAVEFEVLEDSYRKLRGDIYSCLRTFKLVPRTEGSLAPAKTGETKFVDETKLPVTERTERREVRERRLHEAATKDLPAGWRVRKIGRFLVLDHVGDNFKHAKKVVTHAEAVWSWLDRTFDYIGPDEYVPTPILRICKDQREESAYRSGTSWVQDLEITTHKSTDVDTKDWEFEYVNGRVMDIWWEHRDRDLYWAMPYWLRSGLNKVLERGRAKGRRLEFEFDVWDRQSLKRAVKDGKLTPPRDLMQLTNSELMEGLGGQGGFEAFMSRGNQAAGLVRFFVAGAASKSRRTKTVLRDYLLNLRSVTDEIQKAEEGKKPAEEKEPQTEEEEAERLKQRREGWKQKEKEVLQKVFERTFGGWSSGDWKSFDSVYYKSIG
jgi:hypothetical protein